MVGGKSVDRASNKRFELIYICVALVCGSMLGAFTAPESAWLLIAEGMGVVFGVCVTFVFSTKERTVYIGAAIICLCIAAFATTLTGYGIVGVLVPAALAIALFGITRLLHRVA